jgi:hypothetical protein
MWYKYKFYIAGHYALFDATDHANAGDFSYLRTPVFQYPVSIPEVCLSFKYHCYGYAVDALWVYIDRNKTDGDQEYIWHTSYTQSDTWYNYSKTVYDFVGQIVFKGVRGPGINGDLALDDIMITQGACIEAGNSVIINYSCITCKFVD